MPSWHAWPSRSLVVPLFPRNEAEKPVPAHVQAHRSGRATEANPTKRRGSTSQNQTGKLPSHNCDRPNRPEFLSRPKCLNSLEWLPRSQPTRHGVRRRAVPLGQSEMPDRFQLARHPSELQAPFHRWLEVRTRSEIPKPLLLAVWCAMRERGSRGG